MTGNAAWLRARPEIAAAMYDSWEVQERSGKGVDFNVMLAEALPLLRAAIRAAGREDAWATGKQTPVRHVDAHEIGEQRDGRPGGDIVRMRCPNCGHEWKKELPQ